MDQPTRDVRLSCNRWGAKRRRKRTLRRRNRCYAGRSGRIPEKRPQLSPPTVQSAQQALESQATGGSELAEEADVVLVELANVGDVVAAGADALDAEAEGEAGDFFRIV